MKPTTAPTSSGSPSYVLISGATNDSCPSGRDVPQEDCLAAANELTQDWTTISNRDDLLINDWSGLPCKYSLSICDCISDQREHFSPTPRAHAGGCFIYNNAMIDYDGNCGNAGPHSNTQLVCLEVRFVRAWDFSLFFKASTRVPNVCSTNFPSRNLDQHQ